MKTIGFVMATVVFMGSSLAGASDAAAQSASFDGGWTLEQGDGQCALSRYNDNASRVTSAFSLPGGTDYLMFIFGKAELDPPREDFKADLIVNGTRIAKVPATLRQMGDGGAITVEAPVDTLMQANPDGFRIEVMRDGKSLLKDSLAGSREGFDAWRECRAGLDGDGAGDGGDED